MLPTWFSVIWCDMQVMFLWCSWYGCDMECCRCDMRGVDLIGCGSNVIWYKRDVNGIGVIWLWCAWCRCDMAWYECGVLSTWFGVKLTYEREQLLLFQKVHSTSKYNMIMPQSKGFKEGGAIMNGIEAGRQCWINPSAGIYTCTWL